METLDVDVNEAGSVVITATFTDEDGNAATPKTLTYTVTDLDGVVINDIEGADPADALASTMEFVLTGDSLQMSGRFDTHFAFTLKGTYDSDAGSDLNLTAGCKFPITKLIGLNPIS